MQRQQRERACDGDQFRRTHTLMDGSRGGRVPMQLRACRCTPTVPCTPSRCGIRTWGTVTYVRWCRKHAVRAERKLRAPLCRPCHHRRAVDDGDEPTTIEYALRTHGRDARPCMLHAWTGRRARPRRTTLSKVGAIECLFGRMRVKRDLMVPST
jgi:hypothetical protein